MRLYSLTGASSVQHEDHGSFDVDPETGAVEVPHELGLHLHATHHGGRKVWETEDERHARVVAEEIERRRDPASMYDLMQQVAKQAQPADLPAAPVITNPVSGDSLVLLDAAGVSVAGTVEADGTITLYDGDAIVGATISNGGEWSTSLPLADGPHVLSACVTVAGATSEWATPVDVTVEHQASPPAPAPKAEPEPELTPEPKPEPAKKTAAAKKAPAKKTAPNLEK